METLNPIIFSPGACIDKSKEEKTIIEFYHKKLQEKDRQYLDFFWQNLGNFVQKTEEETKSSVRKKWSSFFIDFFSLYPETLLFYYYFDPKFLKIFNAQQKEKLKTSKEESKKRAKELYFHADTPALQDETAVKASVDEGRDYWSKPQGVMKAMELKPGDYIADLGAGGGYFTYHFAKKVGEKGKVFAIDVDPPVIKVLQEGVKERGLKNIEILKNTYISIGIDTPNYLDFVFLCDVHFINQHTFGDPLDPRKINYHRIANLILTFEDVHRVLKKGGKLIYVEAYPHENPTNLPLPLAQVKYFLQQLGFKLVAEYELPRQDFLIFKKR